MGATEGPDGHPRGRGLAQPWAEPGLCPGACLTARTLMLLLFLGGDRNPHACPMSGHIPHAESRVLCSSQEATFGAVTVTRLLPGGVCRVLWDLPALGQPDCELSRDMLGPRHPHTLVLVSGLRPPPRLQHCLCWLPGRSRALPRPSVWDSPRDAGQGAVGGLLATRNVHSGPGGLSPGGQRHKAHCELTLTWTPC